MKRRMYSAMLGAVLVACGGGTPEPKTPDPDWSDSPPVGGGSNDESGGAPATGPMTPEFSKGVDAIKAGEFEAAKAAFSEVIEKAPNRADAHYYLGLAEEQLGDQAAAEAEYKKALELDPKLESAALNLGALYIDTGRPKPAIELIRKALASRPNDPSLKLNLAVALAAADQKDDALAAFEDAVKAAPNEAMFLLTYGHWLGTWGKKPEAVKQLQAAKAAAKGDFAMLAAVAHEQRTFGAFAECIETLDAAVSKKDAAELRVERALCKLGKEDKKGALDDLEAAKKSDPKFAPAHFYLASRYAAAGRWKDVAKSYETYLELAPTGPLANQARERLAVAKKKLKK